MKHENDVSDIIDCLQVDKIYSVIKEIELYKRALYIVFLFLKSETNNFIKEITCKVCENSQAGENP